MKVCEGAIVGAQGKTAGTYRFLLRSWRACCRADALVGRASACCHPSLSSSLVKAKSFSESASSCKAHHNLPSHITGMHTSHPLRCHSIMLLCCITPDD